MLDFLKEILGDAYTEDIGTRVSEEVGRRFVEKSDLEAKDNELKAAKDQLADAAKTIESLQEQGKDLEAVRKEAAEYKARAQQAEKDAAAQLEEYKFDTWWNGQVSANKGRNAAVLRTRQHQPGCRCEDLVRAAEERQRVCLRGYDPASPALCGRHGNDRCDGEQCRHALGHGSAG